LESFLAVSKQFTNLISTSFSENRIQIKLTLARWQLHIYHCLFIYYWTLHREKAFHIVCQKSQSLG